MRIVKVTPLEAAARLLRPFIKPKANPHQEALLHIAMAAMYLLSEPVYSPRTQKIFGFRFLEQAWRDVLRVMIMVGTLDKQDRRWQVGRDGRVVMDGEVQWEPFEGLNVPDNADDYREYLKVRVYDVSHRKVKD